MRKILAAILLVGGTATTASTKRLPVFLVGVGMLNIGVMLAASS